uniref:Uncharacterized protein n=1 Tax=Candidatus Kentrum sp. TUN TaxID=2126343 RepID=A0A451A8J7_9GAMM|nr:MAG: hypothetical protein BECKTUN1418F_GA0071002_103313 [Candidatus Kentron sp. TUN]VFK55885.1 MAG: hypothetical protein BECKTUN1418E_GA0071001_103413 [Candidatus Kentron sp. TUN]VFK62341.1 MAG: hypothetical protein BECKTUN1418D_GA0071000_11732 [Candidatus Kentron sp. TUN]
MNKEIYEVVDHPESSERKDYALKIPVPEDKFSEFIASLLGKKQIIEKDFNGYFAIGKEEIENIHHILVQQIAEQPRGGLAAFNA